MFLKHCSTLQLNSRAETKEAYRYDTITDLNHILPLGDKLYVMRTTHSYII